MPRFFASLILGIPLALAGLAADAAESVALQLKWRHAYQFAGYYVARDKGYYRDAGLDVEIREGWPGIDFVGEVSSGRAQYGTGSASLVLDRNRGASVVALAVIFQHSPDILLVSGSSGITSPQQLVHKRVMTDYSTPAVAAMLLNEAGSLARFEILKQTDDLQGLMDGRVDAVAGYLIDQPSYFLERDFPVTILRPIQYGVDFYGDNLFAAAAELRKHPERVRAFRAASLKGWEYAMKNPEDTIAIVQRYGSALSADHLRFEYQAMRSLMLPDLIEIGHMNPGRWKHIADTYARLGQLAGGYSLHGFLYDPTVDPDDFRRFLQVSSGTIALAVAAILVLFRFNRRLRREIRERGQVESRLRQSEERLTEAQRIAHIGSWELDLASGKAIWSDEEYRLLGYEPGAIEPHFDNFLRAVYPEDRARVQETVESARDDPNGRYHIEHRVVRADGTLRIVDECGQIAFDAEGRPRRLIGTTLDVSERKRIEQALREQETYLRTIFESDPQCIKLLDREGRLLDMNSAGMAMIEADTLDQVRGVRVGDFVAGKDQPAFEEMIREVFRGESRQLVFEVVGARGTRRWLETHSVPLWDSEHETVRALLGVTRDVTERRQAEAKLRLSAAVVESTREGVLITDARSRVVAINRAFTEITGYQEQEVLGRKPGFLTSGRHGREFYRTMWATVRETGSWQGEIWKRRKDGEIFPQWLTISVVRDAAGRTTNYVNVFSDISQLKHSQAQLEFLAHHDPLTGLPNRLLFIARLEHALQRVGRSRDQGAVLFLDLDRFKQVNDSLGHNVGDELLRKVAQRFSRAVRREDTVARLGGDEFTVLMEELRDIGDAAVLADKLIQTLVDSFEIGDQQFFVGTSIGISVYPQDGHTVAQLLRNADTAMYKAKEEGRNTYRFYRAEMTALALQHLVLQGRLRRAIERNELVLYYQPQVDLRNGHLIGLEALVRWNDPEQGMIPPAQFIPVAEETGLVLPLGAWVLNRACAEGRSWLDRGIPFGRISVNVAGRQLQQGDLYSTVRNALEDSGLPPERLELEITESFVMKEAERAIDLLHAIRKLGVKLAIDDFGTGYSSLAYLKLLPFDTLKIDKSFVRDLAEDENDAAIARAVIALGHSLQFTVIAEGVETEAQRQHLLGDGCDQAQGYLFGRPMPAGQVVNFIRSEEASVKRARGSAPAFRA